MPPLWYGARIALLTTSATMIAFINSIVAGASVTLLVNGLGGYHVAVAVTVGVAVAVGLAAVFLAYQQWRYRAAAPREADHA